MGQRLHSKAKAERRLRRATAKFDRLRAEAERIEAKLSEFTETLPRPEEPGDRCYKCGDPVIYRETKRKPKPRQDYAFRGYLWCAGCKTMYHCEKYKYFL